MCNEAAVPVAIHEVKDGRNVVLSRPLQAPEKPISTVEHSCWETYSTKVEKKVMPEAGNREENPNWEESYRK
jgi:hypothetical protein